MRWSRRWSFATSFSPEFAIAGQGASRYTAAHGAPVAQLDRALPSEGRGQRFESSRVRQQNRTLRGK